MKSDDLAIKLTNVHKKYRLYSSPISRLKEWITLGKRPTHHDFWALKNIDLKIKKGEALGVIGENGSGKSTLLKIISGTAWPTIGEVETNGRISALLELGAGFHPDFSGRQNIYINARLLGLTDKEIDERFNDIVRFAELGQFIDAAVRTYSSGMYVRLGFSVASHVSPEILIVDEALSVGDDYFQKKSIDRIKKFRDEGVTVIFVSHSMPTITRFCDRAIWLREGIIEAEGEAKEIVNEYQRYCYRHTFERLKLQGTTDTELKPEEQPILEEQVWGSGKVKFTKVAILNSNGEEVRSLEQGDDVRVRLSYYAFEKIKEPIFGLNIHTIHGVYIYGTNNYNIHPNTIEYIEGPGYVDFDLTNMILHKGKYFLSAMVFDEPDDPYWQNPCDWHNQAYEFIVFAPTEAHGLVAFPGKWSDPKIMDNESEYGVPAEIDLSNQWHFHFLDANWYKPEKDKGNIKYSWSKGDASFLILQKKGKKSLKLKLKAAHPKMKKNPVTVDIFINDKKIGNYLFADTSWQEVQLNYETPEKDQVVKVTIKPARTWSPADIGQVGDDRKLGIALSQASFI
ncbi:MAG: ABC transporter ATP-binding protein [Acidobacteria bacterium]|nr:ABC transporter ATP-binding protein [Acidobacteriota bacterium]